MIRALGLCAAMLADPMLVPLEAARGCALVPAAIEASEATGEPVELLLAVAWRESRFRVDQRNGHYCGAWQARSRGLTCAELQQPQPGALAGAEVLAYFRRISKGKIAKALQRYAGCKHGCIWYATDVLDRVAEWRRRAATW